MQWSELGDWDCELAPHYDTAERMLGVVENPRETAADTLIREYAAEIGVEDTFATTKVGVFLEPRG